VNWEGEEVEADFGMGLAQFTFERERERERGKNESGKQSGSGGKMRKGGIAPPLRTLSHFVDSTAELSNQLMAFFKKIYKLGQVI